VRIGVDATSWENRRGFGRFARNAVRAVVDGWAESSFVLYADRSDGSFASGSEGFPSGVEVRQVPLTTGAASAVGGSGRGLVDVVRLVRAVAADKLDVFLFPSTLTYFPVVRVPTVVGLHDTTTSDYPELAFQGRRARMLWWTKEELARRLATGLFTVSEASKRALVERFNVRPERIAVVPEAPAGAFRPRPSEEVERSLVDLGLDPRAQIIVYAAGISPHKDVETLLTAFAAIAPSVERARLVLAGSLDDEQYLSAADGVRARIRELGLGERVILSGFISDDALACLYTAGSAAVVPSLSEGFGLPAVEAAACGTPVVLSDLAPHRETLGDAALFFAPRDARSLAAHLRSVLGDAELRRSLGERARTAVSGLSWNATGERLRELLVDARERAHDG
jgi:glycosyltransferase involved in cell wall biosynthesis